MLSFFAQNKTTFKITMKVVYLFSSFEFYFNRIHKLKTILLILLSITGNFKNLLEDNSVS